MKQYLPYLLGALVLFVFVLLIALAPVSLSKTFDERLTLRQKDKIPYGTFAAYHLLPQMFPKATIVTNDDSPNSWAGDSILPSGQVVFLTARYFDPTGQELEKMSRFVRGGNFIFIITNSFSYDTGEYFGVSGAEYLFYKQQEDSLKVSLTKPPFPQSTTYEYPGKKFDTYFAEINKARSRVLGRDALGHPNFLQLQSGKGGLFIHLAPLAFSNYFVLHKANIEYYENVLSLLPAYTNKVIWNEYFLIQRKKSNEKEPNVLSVLWQYDAFRWALLTALATLLLYTLVEMRRRQRIIPVIKPPVNDSLDFVRTLGRLYYDKGDHHNLAKKMAAYFLDVVRTRYHISTDQLNADFVMLLHTKSGYAVKELQVIIFFIDDLDHVNHISENDLARFYGQLALFYQNT